METSRYFGSTSVTSRSPIRMRPERRRLEAREDAQCRRLAGARGAEQHQELARLRPRATSSSRTRTGPKDFAILSNVTGTPVVEAIARTPDHS